MMLELSQHFIKPSGGRLDGKFDDFFIFDLFSLKICQSFYQNELKSI